MSKKNLVDTFSVLAGSVLLPASDKPDKREVPTAGREHDTDLLWGATQMAVGSTKELLEAVIIADIFDK